MRRAMTIGQLAKAAGVNVETVRYYQRRGLIAEPPKPPGGQRHYAESVAREIGFLRRAQQLGFTLDEAKVLLGMSDGRSYRKTRLLAEEKYATLGVRVAQLNRMRRHLKRLIDRCRANKGTARCPLIEALLDEGSGRRGFSSSGHR
jgi:MerR family transcriptional regulator, mercuric resistance operon regulatory protein